MAFSVRNTPAKNTIIPILQMNELKLREIKHLPRPLPTRCQSWIWLVLNPVCFLLPVEGQWQWWVTVDPGLAVLPPYRSIHSLGCVQLGGALFMLHSVSMGSLQVCELEAEAVDHELY